MLIIQERDIIAETYFQEKGGGYSNIGIEIHLSTFVGEEHTHCIIEHIIMVKDVVTLYIMGSLGWK